MWNNGFVLVEMLAVLLIISMVYTMFLPLFPKEQDRFNVFRDRYLCTQSAAIASHSRTEVCTEDGQCISFNGKGNVNLARTLEFSGRRYSVIVELGGGRLVYR